MRYLTTIGLEVHVQLRTASKMFCACSAKYGADPNTHVCPVCLGYPGAMPVANGEAVRLTVISGLLLGCDIPERSKFDRKSYFYPDMPKNYQISQYDEPLCVGGKVRIETEDGFKEIRLKRIHLEEDVAKSMHFSKSSGVDFNRAGVPLMEIVTEPDIATPEEAYACLVALKEILVYGGVSDCNLEEGNIRCDVNCSVRKDAGDPLGIKTEMKNLNTFKGVLNSLKYELTRQVETLESGGGIVQETRRWDAEKGVTLSMRTKESEHDYRYFPEPDLPPVIIPGAMLEDWKRDLPELPRQKRDRFQKEYGIPAYDAGVLVADRGVADFFEKSARSCSNAKAVSNWMMTEMLRLLAEKDLAIEEIPMTPDALASLVSLTEKGELNSNAAKEVFAELFEKGGNPKEIVKEKGLTQVSDSGMLQQMVDEAIVANPESVNDYMKGKKAALQFLVGQVMRASKGKANPKMVAELLAGKLSK